MLVKFLNANLKVIANHNNYTHVLKYDMEILYD